MGINLKTFSEFAHSRSVPDLPKTINLPTPSNEKVQGPPKVQNHAYTKSQLDSRRPSLPVTIGLVTNHLNHQVWFSLCDVLLIT